MGDGGRRWLAAGTVAGPHGLDGSFHVRQARPQLLAEGSVVVVGERRLKITRRAGTPARMIVRLEGFGDRAAAERLRGQELLVERSEAPQLEPDEWWAEDLEGCAVRDRDLVVGTVRRLLSLPSCEVLEVQREGRPDLLVPLVTDAVREVDVDRGMIEIDLRFLGET
jgi:16S rRNA processing protein RimM